MTTKTVSLRSKDAAGATVISLKITSEGEVAVVTEPTGKPRAVSISTVSLSARSLISAMPEVT